MEIESDLKKIYTHHLKVLKVSLAAHRLLYDIGQNAEGTHLPLTENRLKFFVPSNPTNNYENIYIW